MSRECTESKGTVILGGLTIEDGTGKGCPSCQGHFEDTVPEKRAGLESEAYEVLCNLLLIFHLLVNDKSTMGGAGSDLCQSGFEEHPCSDTPPPTPSLLGLFTSGS